MRKILYQWGAVGILSLIGWGVDVMPGNTSWIPSGIIWGLASVWLIGTIVYYVKHRNTIRENPMTGGLDNIVPILQQMDSLLREQAIIKAKKPYDKNKYMELMFRINAEIFGLSEKEIEKAKNIKDMNEAFLLSQRMQSAMIKKYGNKPFRVRRRIRR